MHLHKLSLIDFKNIAEAHIELSPQINCLVGDNGTGKTNLLDAVHYLSVGKSGFNFADSQCIRHGADAFLIDGVYRTSEDRSEHIVCSYKKNSQKKLCRGGKEYEKLSDHFGLIPLVMVTPSDTALINESGEERRRYMNSLISQLDRKYLATLRYNHLLAERNKLLKAQQTPNFSEIMEVIDLQMAALGTDINARRKQLIDELAPHVARYYAALSGDREQIKLKYRSELNQLPFDEILRDAQPQDRANQYTTRGVHRDDLRMTLGDYTLRKYGSQGQQKSFLIALKLAQFDLIAGHSPVRPILLLDDIFDKLDMQRVEQLIRIVTSERFGQIFITDCNKVRLENVLQRMPVHPVQRNRRRNPNGMRRRDPIRIGDALNDFFTSTPTIARKIAEARIPDVWPRVVGDIVASYTVRLEIKTGGRLFVYLSSSVVRNEIFMQRAALKEAINRAVGSDILTTIIVK